MRFSSGMSGAGSSTGSVVSLFLWLVLVAFAGGCAGDAETRPKVLLVGLDGADWSLIEPMMERGELPHLALLAERGTRARLRAIQPIISPVIWTTIATGYGPDDHGVIDFTVPDPETGDPIVITSRHRMSKAFWDILTEDGRSVDVVGWWASWPAEEVNGRIVSDRVLSHAFYAESDAEEGLTYPPDLYASLKAGFSSPDDVSFEIAQQFMHIDRARWDAADIHDFNDPVGHFRHIYSTLENSGAAARRLLENPSDVVAAYFEATDTAGHMYMRYAPPAYPYSTEEERQQFGGTVEAFYRAADDQLGKMLAMVGPETYVMVVSDHGFLTGTGRPLEHRANLDYRTAALWHRLDGVMLLAGPGVRADHVLESASVFDVLPTLLYLLDLPVAEDFRGSVLTGAFESPSRAHTIPTYRSRTWSDARKDALAEANQDVDEERMEKLRSLGYIGGAETGSLVSLRGRLALAQYHLFVGDKMEAIEELRGTVADAPDFYEAQYQLGLIAMQSRDLEAAERYFRATLDVEPDYLPAMQNLAFVLRQSGRGDDAIALLERAVEADPLDPGPEVNLAILLRDSGDAAGALARLDGVLGRVPYYPTALVQRALTLHQMGRYAEAVKAWEAVLEVQPQDQRAQGYLEQARAGEPLSGN
ncbi:MAG: alkaline phosphatase family protein [Candidatus Eisenbacteria bacterium]